MARSLLKDFVGKVTEVAAPTIKALQEDILEKIDKHVMNDERRKIFELLGKSFLRLDKYANPNEKMEFKTPITILLLTLKEVQEYQYRQDFDDTSNQDGKMSKEEFEVVKHFGQFAINIYAASKLPQQDNSDTDPKMGRGSNDRIIDQKTIREKMGLNNDNSGDEIFCQRLDDVEEDSDNPCPKFVLFLDNQKEAIVLAIRGTSSETDVIIDLMCDAMEFLDGYAHKGICEGAAMVMNEVKEAFIEAIDKYPNHKVIVTGHSLGAGTAILIAMGLLSELNPYGIQVKNVQCIAIAPPPVYRSCYVIPNEMKAAIKIFVNKNDCVPRMSLANTAKIIAMMSVIDQNEEMTIQEYWKILGPKKLTKASEDDIDKILDGLAQALQRATPPQDQFPVLDHPGTIYHLLKVGQVGNVLYRRKSHYFSRLLSLHDLDDMFKHHKSYKYKRAFEKVKIL